MAVAVRGGEGDLHMTLLKEGEQLFRVMFMLLCLLRLKPCGLRQDKISKRSARRDVSCCCSVIGITE